MGQEDAWVRADLHGLQPMGQPLSTLCWLTCYWMLYIWRGWDPKTIEPKLKAAGLDFRAACTRGLLPAEMQGSARTLGLTPASFTPSISGPNLKQLLQFSPVWAAGEWFRGALHARLVVGASDDWVEYFDPWYGGTYGSDLKRKDLVDTFVHGDGRLVRGTDKLTGKLQLAYWRR